jgi:hypothetical protein
MCGAGSPPGRHISLPSMLKWSHRQPSQHSYRRLSIVRNAIVKAYEIFICLQLAYSKGNIVLAIYIISRALYSKLYSLETLARPT